MSDREARKLADKEVVKEAIQEWLDKQFAVFGKWALGSIFAAIVAGFAYVWLLSQGWHK